MTETGREGLVSFIRLQCSNCSAGGGEVYPLGKKSGRFYDVNRRSVLAMRRIGRGHSASQKFCGVMDMPGPTKEEYFRRHQKVVRDAAVTVA